jgi:thiamine kinase-like enzyme
VTVTGPVDAAITEALELAGLRARAVVEITTIRFPTIGRHTYRIDLDSGETIKARCLEDDSSARRLFEIRQSLPDAFVPAFGCYGRVLLERWADGRLLQRTRPGDEHLVDAAALLAGLHATPVELEQQTRDGRTNAWRLRTESGLQMLVDAGVLDADEADTLSRGLGRDDPGHAAQGLGHFDFCGENMLVDRAGRLRVFDNERVGVGFLGFDVARTWYRWGLPADAWAVFRKAYASASSADGSFAHLDFWRVVALVQSACLRLQVDRSYLAPPIEKLRQIAEA